MGVNNHSPEIKARTAQRTRMICDLRLQGAEFADIGRQLGITEQAANKLYLREMRRIPAADAARARKEHERRLNMLRVKFFELLKMLEGVDKVAVGTLLLRFDQREAKLLGLDAAIKVEQTNIEDPRWLPGASARWRYWTSSRSNSAKSYCARSTNLPTKTMSATPANWTSSFSWLKRDPEFKREVGRSLYKASLAAYIKAVWPIIVPAPLLWNPWHIDAIAQYLTACTMARSPGWS